MTKKFSIQQKPPELSPLKRLEALEPPTPGPTNIPPPKFEPGSTNTPVAVEPGLVEPVAPAPQMRARVADEPGPATTRAPKSTRGYTKEWPHEFWDTIGPTLEPTDAMVLGQLYRLSAGWSRDTCKISHLRLAERVNVSRNTVKRSVAKLEKRGLIVRLGIDVESPSNDERGIIWRVPLATETLPKSEPGPRNTRTKSEPGTTADHMKERKENHETAPQAPSIYEIRTIGARLFERHRSDLGFDHARLADLVADALAAQGREPNAELIEEAIKGMAV